MSLSTLVWSCASREDIRQRIDDRKIGSLRDMIKEWIVNTRTRKAIQVNMWVSTLTNPNEKWTQNESQRSWISKVKVCYPRSVSTVNYASQENLLECFLFFLYELINVRGEEGTEALRPGDCTSSGLNSGSAPNFFSKFTSSKTLKQINEVIIKNTKIKLFNLENGFI